MGKKAPLAASSFPACSQEDAHKRHLANAVMIHSNKTRSPYFKIQYAEEIQVSKVRSQAVQRDCVERLWKHFSCSVPALKEGVVVRGSR